MNTSASEICSPLAAIQQPYFMELDLIYTRNDMIVSKQHKDWRFWQDKFEDYKASLSFNSAEELTEFLTTEYNLTGFSKAMLENDVNQFDADLLLLELPEDKTGSLKFTELNADSLH